MNIILFIKSKSHFTSKLSTFQSWVLKFAVQWVICAGEEKLKISINAKDKWVLKKEKCHRCTCDDTCGLRQSEQNKNE